MSIIPKILLFPSHPLVRFAVMLLVLVSVFSSVRLKAERAREGTEWDVAYWYDANDNKLPRVLLMGDSICRGYQGVVRDELAGTAYVSFWATSKCVTDRSYLKQLAYMLDEYPYAVIHFNNGLHSLSTDRKEWEAGLRSALVLIQEKVPQAKIIWASCTPMTNADLTIKAKSLNEIGARMARENSLPVDDLFGLMDSQDRAIFWTDTYHFDGEGAKMQGQQVAAFIRKALAESKSPKLSSLAKADAPRASIQDGKPAPSGLSKVHFLCNGIRAVNSRFKLEEGVVCYNPSPHEVGSTWTYYTTNAEPTIVKIPLRPRGKTWGHGTPQGAWGLKIEADEPVAAQLFCEHFSVPYQDDFTLTPEFERAYNQYAAISVPTLGKVFYLPDITSGPKPEVQKTVEKQWFTVCNPNKTEARVKFTDDMGKKGAESREITIPGERIAHFEMTEISLSSFEGGSMVINSDAPIAVMQMRTIEGTPHGKFNQIRFSVQSFMLP